MPKPGAMPVPELPLPLMIDPAAPAGATPPTTPTRAGPGMCQGRSSQIIRQSFVCFCCRVWRDGLADVEQPAAAAAAIVILADVGLPTLGPCAGVAAAGGGGLAGGRLGSLDGGSGRRKSGRSHSSPHLGPVPVDELPDELVSAGHTNSTLGTKEMMQPLYNAAYMPSLWSRAAC